MNSIDKGRNSHLPFSIFFIFERIITFERMLEMIIGEYIELELIPKLVLHFESLGYEIPRSPAKWNNKKLVVPRGTKMVVRIDDLPLGSNVMVEYLCDYCGIEKGFKAYQDLINCRSIIQKDCCEMCITLKTRETTLIKHGVEHVSQLESTKNKKKETNLKIYGVESVSQIPEIKTKIKNTFLEKYGETNPMKNKEVREKAIRTNLERYGVEYSQQNKEVKAKQMKTMYENNNAPCSVQQRYIHNLIGGELNMPYGTSFLDIAYFDEKIYIEYDGGGHDLHVKLGFITKEEYEKKERNRWYSMFNKGWREIRIISSKDRIPHDDKILEMIEFAKDYLNSGRHYIKFYLDEGIVKTSQFEQNYDFGNLRYIYKNNIDLTENNAI